MYQTHLNSCREQMSRLKEPYRRMSLWRLLSFLAAVILLCLGYTKQLYGFYIATAAAALAFFLFVSHSRRLKKQLSYLADYESVLLDDQARLTDGWKQFPVHGSRYLQSSNSKASPRISDLDIFGGQSLYQYLCTASTVFGQDCLAGLLSQPDMRPEQIRGRQQAVSELVRKTDFTLRFETAARCLRAVSYDSEKKALEHFFHAAESDSRTPLFLRIFFRTAPVLTLASLFCHFAGIKPDITLTCFLTGAALQLAAALLGNARNSRLLAPVYKMNQTVTPYRTLLELLADEPFESPCLQKLRQTLTDSEKNKNALEAFRELEDIASSVVIRHNIYASFLLNSLFCYDFYCAERYVRWKSKYQTMLKPWLEAVGSVEAFISLGIIARTKQVHTLPQLVQEGRPVLSAKNLRHPLLNNTDAVGNDFDLNHQTCVITGSNMSGKTTFMRSIGVNLVLAYAGGFCAADGLRASCMEICTCMRTADNVSEGISSFYAELLRIQKIVETSKKGQPMLSLIDEIYKGTNSKDRILAAGETVKKLAQPYALTILTTHDLELCELEHDDAIDAVNYYFTEHYDENKILFDYKIRQGRAASSNARFLLHMAGIL